MRKGHTEEIDTKFILIPINQILTSKHTPHDNKSKFMLAIN